MSKLLIVYGTTDGHTQKIGKFVAESARKQGFEVDLVNADAFAPSNRPENYDATIVAASVHASSYQRSVRKWVKANAAELNSRPTAFISVCLGILEKKDPVQSELNRILEGFLKETGWKPILSQFVAGAIPYTRYGILKKWMMRRIAAKAGGGTDTSRDYEYTDWHALWDFVNDFLSQIALHSVRVSIVNMQG